MSRPRPLGSRGVWWLGLLLGLAHCRSSRDTSAEAGQLKVPPGVLDAGSSAAGSPEAGVTTGGAADAAVSLSGTLFPADWCARLGGMAAVPAALAIVGAYTTAVSMNCETAGLISAPALTEDQSGDWFDYLLDYTFLMAGCVPDYEPPEGGIRVFGPANTPITGAMRAPLSSHEATLLTNYYVQAFASELKLSPEEQAAVRAYLLQVALPEVDPAAKGALSRCPAPDAGQ